jgi:hypothetical protein
VVFFSSVVGKYNLNDSYLFKLGENGPISSCPAPADQPAGGWPGQRTGSYPAHGLARLGKVQVRHGLSG